MRPTLQYVVEKFNYYNKLCFNNELPTIPIKLNLRYAQMGVTKFNTVRNSDNTISNTNFSMEISVRMDLPEEEYIDTIVHEMIHYYIGYNNIIDNSPHGHVFKSIMNEITRKYGLKISISFTPEEEELVMTPSRIRYICVASFKDERVGMSVVAKNKLFDFWNIIPQIENVTNVKWYVSNRAIFQTFPVSVTPRLLEMDVSKIHHYLTGAKELENTGKVIRVKE